MFDELIAALEPFELLNALLLLLTVWAFNGWLEIDDETFDWDRLFVDEDDAEAFTTEDANELAFCWLETIDEGFEATTEAVVEAELPVVGTVPVVCWETILAQERDDAGTALFALEFELEPALFTFALFDWFDIDDADVVDELVDELLLLLLLLLLVLLLLLFIVFDEEEEEVVPFHSL